MIPLRVIIVSVDFGDFLAETLPYNRHHYSEVMIVTTPTDSETIEVAKSNNASIYTTDVFHRNGAAFNKFAAIEEALNYFGRHGWIVFKDADIFWPKKMPSDYKEGKLYSIKRRRLLLDTSAPIPREEDWTSLPLDPQYSECMGFTQIFNAKDGVLGSPPWHSLNLHHAALGDSHFQSKWDLSNKVWLDIDCLHFGNYATNWMGRVDRRRDGSIPKRSDEKKQENDKLIKRLWG